MTLGGNGAVLVTAEGAWHAAPPPTTVVSTVGAGDSSLFGYVLGRHRGRTADRAPRPRRGLRQRRRRPARHHDPRRPTQVHARARHRRPPRSWEADHMTELITAELVRLDADLGRDKHEVIRASRRASSATPGAPTDVDQLVEDAFAREATVADRAARRHRDPALPHHRRRRADPRLRPPRAARRLRRQGRARRPGVPDRRAGRRGRHPPPAADQAGPRPGEAGLHRRRCAPPTTPRRSSPWSTWRRCTAASEPAHPPPRRAAAPAASGAGERPAPQHAAERAGAHARWSPSPPARPASRTPTWPPRPWRPRPSGPGSRSPVETQGSAGATPLPARDHRRGRAVIFAVDVGVRDREPVRRQADGLLERQAPDRRRATR